jgi:hypothetical protein
MIRTKRVNGQNDNIRFQNAVSLNPEMGQCSLTSAAMARSAWQYVVFRVILRHRASATKPVAGVTRDTEVETTLMAGSSVAHALVRAVSALVPRPVFLGVRRPGVGKSADAAR